MNKTQVLSIIGVLLICGGAAGYLLLGQDDSDSGSGKGKSSKNKQSKNANATGNSGRTGDSGSDEGEYEEIREAVSSEYTESYVANVDVDGNSATATLGDGTVVPLQFQGGEWVPDVSAPDASGPDPDIPQGSAPEVNTPQVQTPSAPTAPSGP